MADEKIKVEIESKYDDSEAKDAIKDAEKIEKLDPELEINAKDNASDDITNIGEKANRLDDHPYVIELRAEIDQLKSELDTADRKLKETGEVAEDTSRKLDKVGGEGGIKTRGNAIADLTGPLGDASSAASDFAGVFDGIGDIAGDVAGKVGLSAAAMESAIGGIGIAIAVAAAAWAFFSGKSADAKRKQEANVKAQEDLNDALREGKAIVAATKFDELYGGGIDAGHKLKLSTQEAYDFIAKGVPNEKLDDAKTKLAEMQTAFDNYMRTGQGNPEDFAGISNLKIQVSALEANRAKYVDLNGVIATNEAAQKDLEAAMGLTNETTNDGTTATDKYAEAQRKAKMKTDQAKAAIDLQTIAIQGLKGELDDEQAILNFQETMLGAQNKIKENGALTKQEMLDVKNSIIDVGTTAGLTKVEIQTEIDKVTPTDVNTAFYETQQLINQHGDLKMQAKIQATIDATVTAHSGAKFGLGPDGVLRPTGTSASGASAPAPAPAMTQQFTINVPRGYRELDAAQAAHRVAKRSGRIYARR